MTISRRNFLTLLGSTALAPIATKVALPSSYRAQMVGASLNEWGDSIRITSGALDLQPYRNLYLEQVSEAVFKSFRRVSGSKPMDGAILNGELGSYHGIRYIDNSGKTWDEAMADLIEPRIEMFDKIPMTSYRWIARDGVMREA